MHFSPDHWQFPQIEFSNSKGDGIRYAVYIHFPNHAVRVNLRYFNPTSIDTTGRYVARRTPDECNVDDPDYRPSNSGSRFSENAWTPSA